MVPIPSREPLPFISDVKRNALWIVPAKCASTSILTGMGYRRNASDHKQFISTTKIEALRINRAGAFTIASIRHPLDRAVGAVWRVTGEELPTRFSEYLRELISKNDPHIFPQSVILDGFRVDHWLRFNSINEDWETLRTRIPELPELPHDNHNPQRPRGWRGVTDWAEFTKYFQQDLSLFPAD